MEKSGRAHGSLLLHRNGLAPSTSCRSPGAPKCELSSTLAILGLRWARAWPQIERGSAGLQVEDWFCVDDLVSALEGELEAAEVSEGAPAAAYGRPIQQLAGNAGRDRTQPCHGGVAGAMAQRIAATAGLHLEGLEPGDDLGKLG